ncbi:hypothetical protein ACP275_06G201600 [Erythranthe tilingii]
MEGAKEQQQQQQKTKISFGFSSAHDKIKLIDILSEADDDFLVPSPFFDSHQNPFSENARDNIGFRLSGFGNNSSEIELIRQNEQNVLPSDFTHPTRPSFLRRSLAWDSAFFDSPGVLDHDELSFINKGFTKDVRKRRSETESNADDNSVEWFEIAPSIYKAKSHKPLHVENRSRLKQEGLQNARVVNNVEKSLTNKMKSNQISTGKSIDVRKNESISRMRKGMISSPKPPKALGRTTYISTRLSNRDFSGTTTTTTTTCSDSRLPNRKTESGNSKLSTKIQRDEAEKGSSNKRMGNVSLSTSSLSLSNNPPFIASPVISTGNYSSESRSAKSLKPSELRPPSPQMRFFDENTPTRYHGGIATSRKFPQKEYSVSINDKYASACKKVIKTPTSEAAKKVKRPTANHLATAGEIHGKRPRNKLGLNSTLEEEKRRDTLKSKRCRESINNGNTTFSELASISKCLEAIDLNQDINRKPKKGVQNIGNYDSALLKSKPFQLSPPPTSTRRTPLAEKMYSRNSIGAFALPMEMKREKLG